MIDTGISEVKRETLDIFEGCRVRLTGVSNILLETRKKNGGEPNKEGKKCVWANVDKGRLQMEANKNYSCVLKASLLLQRETRL